MILCFRISCASAIFCFIVCFSKSCNISQGILPCESILLSRTSFFLTSGEKAMSYATVLKYPASVPFASFPPVPYLLALVYRRRRGSTLRGISRYSLICLVASILRAALQRTGSSFNIPCQSTIPVRLLWNGIQTPLVVAPAQFFSHFLYVLVFLCSYLNVIYVVFTHVKLA